MWMRAYATSQRRGTAPCHGRFTVPKVFPLGPLAIFLIWEKLVVAALQNAQKPQDETDDREEQLRWMHVCATAQSLGVASCLACLAIPFIGVRPQRGQALLSRITTQVDA